MKCKLFALGLVLILSALILGGCRPATAQPSELPTVVSTEVTPEGPVDVEYAAARDAALATISERYGEQPPPPGSAWTWESPARVAGRDSYQYTAGDWVVTISRLVVLPDSAAYRVIVTNQNTGFWWRGEVDAAGQVTESHPRPPAVEFAAARDAALAYLAERYGEQALPSGLAWATEPIVLEEPVESGGYRYTADEWVVTVTCPLAGPKRVTYRVRVANETTGFRWEGHVDEEGPVWGAPEDLLAARDAVLAYVREQYGDQAPALELSWMEELTSPELVPGGISYRFTAEDCVVTVDTAVVPPEMRVYRMSVGNPTTGFWWEGRIDATGQVAERIAPDEVRAARDAALAYILYHYSEEVAPAEGRTWTEERTTPEEWIGGATYEFTTGDWVVTISYPVLPPERVVCQVVVANQTTGFWWEGKVDAAGQVTELSASTEPTVDIRDPGRALNVALAYVIENYGEQAPSSDVTWVGDRPPPEELIDGFTIEFTSESAPDWVVTVSYALVDPESVVFQVVVADVTTGFQWEGEVDAAGLVTEKVAPQ